MYWAMGRVCFGPILLPATDKYSREFLWVMREVNKPLASVGVR